MNTQRAGWPYRRPLILGSLVARIEREGRIRRDVARLEKMDDHRLRDIGLSRSDLRTVTRSGRT